MSIEITPKDEQDAAGDAGEVIDLFTITSTGKAYTCEKRPRMRDGLKFARMIARGQENQATTFLMESVIGVEEYGELLECEDVDDDDLEAIGSLCVKIMRGSEAAAPKDRKPKTAKKPAKITAGA